MTYGRKYLCWKLNKLPLCLYPSILKLLQGSVVPETKLSEAFTFNE